MSASDDNLDYLKPPPLSWNTVTMSEVRTKIQLKEEARGQDAKLRKESEGGCPAGFRSHK